jgi:hypothetical protein
VHESILIREGVGIFENGELAWMKVVILRNVVKGAGTNEQY